MKITGITWSTTPRLPGLRASEVNKIDVAQPGALKDWRVLIRGSQVYFVSPVGWHRDQSKKRDPNGSTTVFGPIPMSELYIEWQIDNDKELVALLAGKLTYDSEPFGFTPAVLDPTKPILDQIPPGQMGDA